jgi:hypothetical protein
MRATICAELKEKIEAETLGAKNESVKTAVRVTGRGESIPLTCKTIRQVDGKISVD